MKKTTVSTMIDDDVRRRARVKAAQEDKSLSQVIRELLERWLSSKPTPGNDSPQSKQE